MADHQALDEIAEKITQGLRLLGGLRHEAEGQIRAIVEGALAHFDVVTQERMEVQEAMLQKSREQLDELEARVGALEDRIESLEQQQKKNDQG